MKVVHEVVCWVCRAGETLEVWGGGPLEPPQQKGWGLGKGDPRAERLFWALRMQTKDEGCCISVTILHIKDWNTTRLCIYPLALPGNGLDLVMDMILVPLGGSGWGGGGLFLSLVTKN